MPFKKVASDRYVSPTGRSYNAAQVRLYYANGGKFPGQKRPAAELKGPTPKVNYAAGLRR